MEEAVFQFLLRVDCMDLVAVVLALLLTRIWYFSDARGKAVDFLSRKIKKITGW
jgi:hypothetical protein